MDQNNNVPKPWFLSKMSVSSSFFVGFARQNPTFSIRKVKNCNFLKIIWKSVFQSSTGLPPEKVSTRSISDDIVRDCEVHIALLRKWTLKMSKIQNMKFLKQLFTKMQLDLMTWSWGTNLTKTFSPQKTVIFKDFWKIFEKFHFGSNVCFLQTSLIFKKKTKQNKILGFPQNSVFLSNKRHSVKNCHNFYLPHMEYEGSIGLVTRKMKFFYCWFSCFRTYYD
jgi:hypothetical protein